MYLATRRNVVLLVALILLLGTVIEEASTHRIMQFATGVFGGWPGESVQLGAPPPLKGRASEAHRAAASGSEAVSVPAVLPESEVSVDADLSNPPSADLPPDTLDKTNASHAPGETSSGDSLASSASQTGPTSVARVRGVNPFVTSLFTQLGSASGLGVGQSESDAETAARLVFPSSAGVGLTGANTLGSETSITGDGATATTVGNATESSHGATGDLSAFEKLGILGVTGPSLGDTDALSAGVVIDAATDASREDVLQFVSAYYGSISGPSAPLEAILRAELSGADTDSPLADSAIANPEPRTLVLLGSGLLSLMFWRRVKR